MGHARLWSERVALILVGVAIAAVCYAATIKANLGLGPLYAVQEGVSGHLGISIGRSVWVVGATLCVIAALLRMLPGPATVALPFLMGIFLDAILPHMPEINGLALRLAVVVIATWFMALGGALVIRARIGAAAPDLCMLAISRNTGRSNRAVRLTMEGSWLVMGWLLGGTIGVGTVITGVLVGPALQFWIERVTPTFSAEAPPVSLLELS
ncbi:MAG TPA: hypothetical protein VMZ22_00770 [Acidimicrobiales bacterium]|nr:hypothetical protein [Acidimicrobiales bacterium]